MSKTAKVTVTVKTVPHPNPQRLIDVFARLVVNELLRLDKAPEIGTHQATGGQWL